MQSNDSIIVATRNSIFRIVKHDGQSSINNTVLRRADLSWYAKGIHAYLFTFSSGHDISFSVLFDNFPDEEHNTTAGIRELMSCGYIVRSAVRNANGSLKQFVYLVHDHVPGSEPLLPVKADHASRDPHTVKNAVVSGAGNIKTCKAVSNSCGSIYFPATSSRQEAYSLVEKVIAFKYQNKVLKDYIRDITAYREFLVTKSMQGVLAIPDGYRDISSVSHKPMRTSLLPGTRVLIGGVSYEIDENGGCSTKDGYYPEGRIRSLIDSGEILIRAGDNTESKIMDGGFASLILAFSISLFLILCGSFPVFADQLSDANDAASSAAASANSYYGSSGAASQNIGVPMTGGGLMYTLDGETAFNAKISCPSSQQFLEVFVQPGSTGDLASVYIAQDTNSSGSFDYTLQVPYAVSGVCSNGIISCTPGTWSGCLPLKWAVDSNKHVTLENTSWGLVGGCYCINNSCGTGLAWKNINAILKDIGAGVVGAIQAKDSSKAVTAVKIQNYSILYYGQNTSGCQAAGSYSGISSPASLFAGGKTDAILNAYTEAEKSSQSLDQSSYYSLLSGVQSQHSSSSNTCTIIRNITLSPIHICPAGTSYQTSGYCEMNATQNNPSITSGALSCARASGISGSGDTLTFEGCGSIRVPGATFSGSATIPTLDQAVDGNGITITTRGSGSVSVSGYSAGGGICRVNGLTSNGSNTVSFPNDVPCGFLSFTAPYECPSGYTVSGSICRIAPTADDNISENVSDGCSSLASNSECTLKEESVDGVTTYTAYHPTGLTPMSSCKTVVGSISHNLCRPWWVKNRTYSCAGNSNYDFTELKSNLKKIHDTATVSSDYTSFTYSSIRKADGSYVVENVSTTDMQTLGKEFSICEQACKLRKPADNTKASTYGNASQVQNSSVTYNMIYKRCTDSGCPVGDGEELLKDCQCINEFAEAVSILAVLGAASNDATCSSGVLQ